MKVLLVLLAILVVWHLVPHLFVLTRRAMPLAQRLQCCASMFTGGMTSLLVLLPDLTAPLVVPLALLFTKPADNQLPWLFRWWDNDVSINGDWPQYWDPAYTGTTYYANYPPRSFMARYIWLGLRNRASWLAQRLGYLWNPNAPMTHQSWGDPATDRNHAGWVINECQGVYQLYRVQYLGTLFGQPLCVRTNYGHKVGTGGDDRARAMVVGICVSVLGYQGPT